MAKVVLTSIIDELHGKLDKRTDIVMRRKTYRSTNGEVIAVGEQEAYTIVNPRDYTKTPPTGAELANINLFTESKQRTTAIINASRLTDDELAAMTLAERNRALALRDKFADYYRRFRAQFKRPDPEAPLDKKPHPLSARPQRKQYRKIDNFIQALERQQLLSNPE